MLLWAPLALSDALIAHGGLPYSKLTESQAYAAAPEGSLAMATALLSSSS